MSVWLDWKVPPRSVGDRLRGQTRALVLALAAAAAVADCGQVRQVRQVRQAPPAGPPSEAPTQAPSGPTIADRVEQYGPPARARLLPFFTAAGVPYPPARFLLLGLKREHELQLYAAGPAQSLAFIRSFEIFGESGDLGPKLREGDLQVPEGVYRVVYLNPNSIAHVSLALSYPNDFDRMHAEEDGREPAVLGGDIMIHGGSGSVGCLAIGDRAAEDLFVLAADAGWEQAVIVISPVDFRRRALPADYRPSASWVDQLYAWLRSTLRALPTPPPSPRAAAQPPPADRPGARAGM
jgi:hypothetical protein